MALPPEYGQSSPPQRGTPPFRLQKRPSPWGPRRPAHSRSSAAIGPPGRPTSFWPQATTTPAGALGMRPVGGAGLTAATMGNGIDGQCGPSSQALLSRRADRRELVRHLSIPAPKGHPDGDRGLRRGHQGGPLTPRSAGPPWCGHPLLASKLLALAPTDILSDSIAVMHVAPLPYYGRHPQPHKTARGSRCDSFTGRTPKDIYMGIEWAADDPSASN